ncbi:MIEN1 [Cordylochernes scorpioides]|uniref:MIEN1 n=1 Tax=Cordylochernes scorpioides TaxID=51811 RepID=A0ABY6KHE7_9ARAC|nr:MIEN1 [Cordylochernes scorpioides]
MKPKCRRLLSTGPGMIIHAVRLQISKRSIGQWYEPRYRELEKKLKVVLPDAKVTGGVGRLSSFEVNVNGQNVFSKLQVGSFPDQIEMTRVIIEFIKTKQLRKVGKLEPGCTIM